MHGGFGGRRLETQAMLCAGRPPNHLQVYAFEYPKLAQTRGTPTTGCKKRNPQLGCIF
jgi:hypothetical protein